MTHKPTYEQLEQRIRELESAEREHRLAEEALQKSEAFIRAVMDHLPIGVAVNSVHPTVAFTYMNDNFPEIYRTTREALADPGAFWEVVYEDVVFREELKKRVTEDCASGDPDRMHWEDVPVARNGKDTFFICARNIPVKGAQEMISTVWDVTDRKQAEEALRHRLVYEKLLSRISTLAIQEKDTERFQDKALATLGETLRVSRAYLFEHRHETDTMDNTVEWCFPGVSPQKKNLQALPAGAFPWWVSRLREGETLSFSDIEDIPDRGAREILRSQDIFSILVVPLFVAGRYYGFMGFDECSRHRGWPAEDVEILQAMSRIITGAIDRKQTEKALAESEARFKALFRESPVSIIVHDKDSGEIVDANEAAWTAYGFTSLEELQANGFWMDPPFSFTEALAWIRKAATQGAQNFEWKNRKITGEIFWEQVFLRLVTINNIGRVLATTVDITERKSAEEALRKNEKQYRSLFNSIRDAIVVTDTNRTIIDCNPAFRDLFGYSREQILGKQTLVLYENEKAFRDVGAAIQDHMGDPGFFFPVAYKKADGLVFPGETTIFYLRDDDEAIVGLIGLIRDVTDRKRAEKDREKLQAQLIQAQKMESVGRLAGGVAHDFNNMLGAILGNAELAMASLNPEDPLHGTLQEIFAAARRSADITRQLLAFARKQTIAPRVLDLNQTVEGMLKMLRRLIGENINLTWLPNAKIWPIKMDPSQIDQILANLCTNARDAIVDVGKITIETGTVTFDAAYCSQHPGFVPGEFVLLGVSDDGSGMDQETQANLFEPFFTTKDLDKGTGLGLAMVYGIVKQNNGFINVYSEPGQGTTIKIYLPRHQAGKEPERKKEPAGVGVGGSETILLVEDEPSILKMTATMLDRMGYTVLTAGAPGKAINLARDYAGEIQLLITDVVMPEMNGRDLARNLVSLYPNLKSLFMSGYTANVIAHHGVLDEGVQFIPKPFAIQDLAIKVREVLDDIKP